MTINEHQINKMGEQQLLQDIADQTELVDESRRHFTKSGLVVSGVLLTLVSRPSLGGGGGYGGGHVCKSPSGFLSGNLSHHGSHQHGGGKSCDYWRTNCHSWGSTHCDSHFSGDFDCSHASKCSHDSKNNPYTLLDILCRKHVGYVQNYSYSGGGSSYSGGGSSYGGGGSSYGGGGSSYGGGSWGYSYGGNYRTCDQNGYDKTAYNNLACPDFTPYKDVDSDCDIDTLGMHCVAATLNCRNGYTPFLKEETVKAIFKECKAKGYFEPTAGVHWSVSKCVDYIKSTQDCTYYS